MDYVSCPNPHYIPGYTGFCPQLQYRVGDSYGKATYKLFLDPSVCHAEKLVLSDRDANDFHLRLPGETKKQSAPNKDIPAQPGDEGFIGPYACEYFEKMGEHDCGKCDMAFYNKLRKKWSTCPKSDVPHESRLIDPRTIYHRHIGQLPNYTGHIPGLPFRIGKPYGNDTIDSKRWLRGDYNN